VGVGSDVPRHILAREIEVGLRASLYAIPALVRAATGGRRVESGMHNLASRSRRAVCFVIRLVVLYFDLCVPEPFDRSDLDSHRAAPTKRSRLRKTTVTPPAGACDRPVADGGRLLNLRLVNCSAGLGPNSSCSRSR
jgi:hypothetical protein